MLLPDRKYRGIWHRVLHDKTADAILEQVSRLPHANVTSVPFHLDAVDQDRVPLSAIVTRRGARNGEGRGAPAPEPTTHDADADADVTVTRAGLHPDRLGPLAAARAGGRQGPLGPRRARSTTPPPWS